MTNLSRVASLFQGESPALLSWARTVQQLPLEESPTTTWHGCVAGSSAVRWGRTGGQGMRGAGLTARWASGVGRGHNEPSTVRVGVRMRMSTGGGGARSLYATPPLEHPPPPEF